MSGQPAPVPWSLPRQQAPIDSQGSNPPSAPAAEEPSVRSAPASGAWTDPAAQTSFRALPPPQPIRYPPGPGLIWLSYRWMSSPQVMGESCPSSRLSLPSSCSASRCSGDTTATGSLPGPGQVGAQVPQHRGRRKKIGLYIWKRAALHESISRWNQSSQTLLGGGSNGAFYFSAATVSWGPQISVSDSINVKYGLLLLLSYGGSEQSPEKSFCRTRSRRGGGGLSPPNLWTENVPASSPSSWWSRR